ncbi:hypothetical protein WA026_005294 [Henosepilachna vigintioctopunctata]|uniref:Histidine-rich glycoprotein-like n=1 Tax=Henosepilachna vigintioctopunctata TaxID=420089 RepID=A0AAW1UMP6_9CUCU
MGSWTLAGVVLFLLTKFINSSAIAPGYDSVRRDSQYPENAVGKLGIHADHSSKRYNFPSSAPISFPFTANDAIKDKRYINSKYENYQDDYTGVVKQFNDDEDFKSNDFLGKSTGFSPYKVSRSYNYNGPHQLETIETRSFHRKSEPYSLHEFEHKHTGEEEHAEVHYHQHKHLHKHAHKQEHLHKHKQDHKHNHAHKHDEQEAHKHNHKHEHDHKHNNEHQHKHIAHHKHEHKQEHKHDHHHGHKHEHNHQHDHKHDAHHKHGHKHEHSHKHDNHHQHKHNHHHGHDHHNKHHHKHGHKHHHSHKHSHKKY